MALSSAGRQSTHRLIHVSLVAGPAAQARLTAALIPRTRTTYAGAVEVGEDLMTIVVGDRVEVRRFTPRP
jgi:hypothetical protein